MTARDGQLQVTAHRARASASRRRRISAPVTLAAFVLACIAGAAIAQYQVNRQIYGSAGPTNSIRYTPGYSRAAPYAPSSAMLLPSEVRNYAYKSGALPSDIRSGYSRVGPLSPTGAIAYLAPAPSYGASAAAGPQGNRLNTLAGNNAFSGSVAASPFVVNNVGSIRYAGAPVGGYAYSNPVGVSQAAAVSGGMYRPAQISAAVNSPPINASAFSTPFSGSIRYGSP